MKAALDCTMSLGPRTGTGGGQSDAVVASCTALSLAAVSKFRFPATLGSFPADSAAVTRSLLAPLLVLFELLVSFKSIVNSTICFRILGNLFVSCIQRDRTMQQANKEHGDWVPHRYHQGCCKLIRASTPRVHTSIAISEQLFVSQPCAILFLVTFLVPQ